MLILPGCNALSEFRFDKLRAAAPDLLLLGKPGIVRKQILDIPRVGTLNCHPGKLPCYRGNDVIYWTCLHKDFHHLGYSIHLVDEGVDTGPVISFTSAPPRQGENIPMAAKPGGTA